MKRKPNQPDTGPNPRTGTARRWAARRRTMTNQLLRGACYGAGTGATCLIIWWIEQHM